MDVEACSSYRMKELPIACELTPAELAARREGLLPGLLEKAQQRMRLSNGLRFSFAPSSEFLRAAVQTIVLSGSAASF